MLRKSYLVKTKFQRHVWHIDIRVYIAIEHHLQNTETNQQHLSFLYMNHAKKAIKHWYVLFRKAYSSLLAHPHNSLINHEQSYRNGKDSSAPPPDSTATRSVPPHCHVPSLPLSSRDTTARSLSMPLQFLPGCRQRKHIRESASPSVCPAMDSQRWHACEWRRSCR